MVLKIDQGIVDKFQNVTLGVLVVSGINNAGSDDSIVRLLRDQEKSIKQKLTQEFLQMHPHIAVWKEAYKAFGAKPKEHRSSIENLCKLVLSGVELKSINKLVDLYNVMSLKHLLPAGGEDLAKVQGDILLTFAGPSESAVLLLGDKEARPPNNGEVIYKDELGAICRRWNWREVDRTKLTEKTTAAVLVIEGVGSIDKQLIVNASQELQQLIKQFCGGTSQLFILDADQLNAEF